MVIQINVAFPEFNHIHINIASWFIPVTVFINGISLTRLSDQHK